MKKQLNYKNIFTETLILTGAIAIIAAAVYFFLVPSHTSVSSISGLGIILSNFVPLPLVRDHDDSECHTSDYRLSYLRSGIWCKNRIYQHHAPGLSWNI